MTKFNADFKFDHTTCVVDNGDYGLAFNRFTGKVLAQYGQDHEVLLVDVEEYRRAYGEYPPNETLNTALDFSYWYQPPTPSQNGVTYDVMLAVAYDPPEADFRTEVLRDKLLQHFMPSVTDYARFDGIRDIEIRPWRYCKTFLAGTGPVESGGIEECKPEDAEAWGLYGRTFNGPAWHLCDVASKEQAYWLRAALAPLLIVTPRLADPYEAAKARMEALDGVKFDPEGR